MEDKAFLGSGWAFPISFSAATYEVRTTQYEQNINESIDIILQTTRGERIMEPSFGSGLRQFFFRKMDDELKTEIKHVIMDSLRENEPRITVKGVQVNFVDPQNGRIEILITYEYNQTNTRHNYVFPFHIIEGTNL